MSEPLEDDELSALVSYEGSEWLFALTGGTEIRVRLAEKNDPGGQAGSALLEPLRLEVQIDDIVCRSDVLADRDAYDVGEAMRGEYASMGLDDT